jgi:hypothetical protein
MVNACFAPEPESEPEVARGSAKRKSPASEQVLPPSKRIKTPTTDDSETEPESDEEQQLGSKTPHQPNNSKMEASDSETESEDEMDSNSVKRNPVLQPSPTDKDVDFQSKTRFPACSRSSCPRSYDIGQTRGHYGTRVNQYISPRIPEGGCRFFLGTI